MSNICKLIQIKLNKWIKVLLQGSVSAGFDASLDTAPDSLSGPILQLQICRWSRRHPPGAISSIFQPDKHRLISFPVAGGSDSWRCRVSEEIHLLLFLLISDKEISVLTSSHSFFTWWQRSLTSSTQSHKSAGKVNQTAAAEAKQAMVHLFLRRD